MQSAIASPDENFSLRGGPLLKAIRTTFDIFLFSKAVDVQVAAQNHLQTMTQKVFERVPKLKIEENESETKIYDKELKDAMKVFKTFAIISSKPTTFPEGY